MGNSMACCGKSESDPNNINTEGFTKDMHGGDKIGLIVRI